MNNTFKGWQEVSSKLHTFAAEPQAIEQQAIEQAHMQGPEKNPKPRLDVGQRASLKALADRLPKNGVLIADEVGMGKTRIAVETARAVIESGGRVAILVPPGLGYQWREELKDGGVELPQFVRSLDIYLSPWRHISKRVETPPKPWFEQKAVLISHAFSNWRLGEKSDRWRWALLPEIYAHWRKREEGRFPRGYHDQKNLHEKNEEVAAAAESICSAIPKNKNDRAHILCDELSEKTPWPDAWEAKEYGGGEKALRYWLERAVGLGFGMFDLVIVDEAHKSRGDDSGLSRLLDSIILRAADVRVLAMTATPVELDIKQWKSTFSRIGVDIEKPPAISDAINAYASAVQQVQLKLSDPGCRLAYEQAASNFKAQLSPYLLRRDKREDAAVKVFNAKTKADNITMHYRHVDQITIELENLTDPWRQAVCAAEALSMIQQQDESTQVKRLRLTFGNGHGLANALDWNADDIAAEENAETSGKPADANQPETAPDDSKRKQRIQWWRTTMQSALASEQGNYLYNHPALLACVEAIETANQHGEKVLVFGRFTQPLKALVELLNARQMLRCLQDGRAWPQAGIGDSEHAAVEAALRQLACPLSLGTVNEKLGHQYKNLENMRERWRNGLMEKIKNGLGLGDALPEKQTKEQGLFRALQASLLNPTTDTRISTLSLLSKALIDLLPDPEKADDKIIAEGFRQLINALSDRDEGDADGNGELDAEEAHQLWPHLEERLREEYDRPQGGFARLMDGGTAQSTRRLLQLAFNRPKSYPRVLVTQSMVGREGLNLHLACSTVILLHHEWNPGIVEQQIGRIDRVGSHWSTQLRDAIAKNTETRQLPRINVRPVIFKGTYDEHHWRVLSERWDNLRAQLHGVVISDRLYANDPQLQQWARELEAKAPKFSPQSEP